MSKLILEDLVESTELDAAAMTHIRGGLNADIQTVQLADQSIANLLGSLGSGSLVAVNAPTNIPINTLTEVNPNIDINLELNNLIGAAQNQIQS